MLKQFGKNKTENISNGKSDSFDSPLTSKLFQQEELDAKLLEDWLENLIYTFEGDEGAVFLESDEDLLCKTTVGTTSFVEGRKISKKEGLAAWLIQSLKPAFLPQAQKDIRFDKKTNIFEPTPESILAAPITFANRTFGIIQINRRKPLKPFTDIDARNLFSISKVFGLYLSYLDLSQEKKKEETVDLKVEGKLPFSVISEITPIGFFIINDNLKIIFANNFALDSLGFNRNETVGKKCLEIVVSNDVKGDSPLLSEFLTTFPEKSFFQSPLHLNRKDGHEITVAFGVSPFNYKDRKFVVLYFTNPAEWEMVYSKEDDFITNVAHELRTPLFAILGSLSILEQELNRTENLPPTTKNFLNIIREEGQKFSNVLNALLDFDEVSKWNIGLKRETVPILDLISQIAIGFKQKAKESNILFDVDFPEESIKISGDKLALQYSFSHIIDNAIKFNKPGGKVSISTKGMILRDSSWNFEIVIKDTGIGIPKSEIPYLFGKFYRVEKKVHTISGFGLGLTIVKDIIEMHGGNISIESEIDKGTTVTVQLPTMEI